MRHSTVILASLVLVYCAGTVLAGPFPSWEQYKKEFSKQYSSIEEELDRKEIYEENLKFIQENQYKNGVELGVNEFSDMSDEEFFEKNTMYQDQDEDEEELFNSIEVYEPDEDEYDALPTQWDWREHIAFNPVENQGHCGSCWAFSTTLAAEAQYAIHQKRLVHLSKQELIDCTLNTYDKHYINHGCHSGYPAESFRYMKTNGVHQAAIYPYKALNGTCYTSRLLNETQDELHQPLKIDDYRRLPFNGSDLAMMTVVATNGPITVSINGHDPLLKSYKSGILRNVMPHMRLTTHSVTLIGYGTSDDGIDYWLIRNSWGPVWGDHGHIKIERHYNQVGINNQPVYPILNPKPEVH